MNHGMDGFSQENEYSDDSLSNENAELQEMAKKIAEGQSQHEKLLRENDLLQKRYEQSKAFLEQEQLKKRKVKNAVQDWNQTLGETESFQKAVFEIPRESIRAVQSEVNTLARNTESLGNTLVKSYEVNLAASKMTFLTMQYEQQFSGYLKTRRIVEGCLRAIEAPGSLIRDPARYVEETYLESSSYWLAYAGSAVVFRAYSNDFSIEEEERVEWQKKADSMEHHAMLIDESNTHMFFILTDLSMGRISEAQDRGIAFLSDLQEENMDDSFQFLLQAWLQGALGESPALLQSLRDYYTKMEERAKTIDPAYFERIVLRTKRFAENFATPDVEQFPLLKSYCPSVYTQMHGLLRMAQKNKEIVHYLEKSISLQKYSVRKGTEQNRLQQALLNLIHQKTAEEQEIYREIERCNAIIRTDGDVQEAERWFEQKEKYRNKTILLPDLLFSWALENDNEIMDPAVRRFSIMKLSDLLSDGFLEYAQQYREKYRELFQGDENGFPIEIGGWKGYCRPSEEAAAVSSLRRHTMFTLPRRLILDPYAFLSLGAFAVSLLILVIAVGKNDILVLAVSLTMACLSTVSFILRTRGLWIDILDDCTHYTDILHAVLSQAAQWEEMYSESDRWNGMLISMIEDCREKDDLFI